MQDIFAYTEATQADNAPNLVVREEQHESSSLTFYIDDGLSISSINLPNDQVDELLDALISHRYLRNSTTG